MAKVKKKAKATGGPPSTVRAFRMEDSVHDQLKEIAKAENRKIGHQLMVIIRSAHAAMIAQNGAQKAA